MKKAIKFLREIMANSIFLRILSVIIAIGVWIYIVNFANPTKSEDYTNIPISFVYEGTVPYNNSLMPLVTNKNFFVNIRVSGPRSNLLAFSKEKIHASLNFNSVAAEGTYDVPISISLDDEKLTYEIIGDEYVSLEFAKKSTLTLDVNFRKIGNYKTGYVVIEKTVAPATITVEGPKSVIETINSAEVQVDVSDYSKSIIEIADINLLTQDREYVDRTYLTLSESQATVSVALQYRKSVKVTVSVINSNGGDETLYTNVSYSPSQYLQLGGDEELLSLIDNYNIGTIDTSEITEGSKTFDFTVRDQDSIYVVGDNKTVSVTVDLSGATTKNFRLTSEILASCKFLNVPGNMNPSITNTSKIISIRSLSYTLGEITADSLKLSVDLSSTPNEKGEYPLIIELPSGVSGALMNKYYVSVELRNENE